MPSTPEKPKPVFGQRTWMIVLALAVANVIFNRAPYVWPSFLLYGALGVLVIDFFVLLFKQERYERDAIARFNAEVREELGHNEATCTGCGCTDSHGCEDPSGPGGVCYWIVVDREGRTGVCSRCERTLYAVGTQ